ncbi:invasin domain 3-containing protein [Rhodohalobacter mucosus]|uniref:Intimin n=1 Tax=Rhodohalobacter mucosus TaxID=2079485 RepID=A0A316TY18_9BACT|nr:invasin domain 3-containing protein [Rhodohalobacter mucosus]PWN07624.1 hypothetical protein DDZ15_05045 [Rhodohalobacter mucosus]
MINRFSGILLLMLWLTGGMAYSQNVTLSIPDSTVEAGATLLLPVSVSELTAGDQVLSGEWQFTVSSDIAEITGVTTDGTLLQGKDVQYNATNREFAFSSTDPVTGTGVILFLQVQIAADAVKFQESVIGITTAQFNEGTPAIDAISGTLRIKGISLTPKSPSPPLVVGQTFQFNVSGDVAEPVTWSSSNTGIATVTSTGLAEGITSGSVKIFVEDAEGQRDSTDLFRVEPATLLDLTVGVSDATVTQTLEGEVGVEVSDLTGLDIRSGEISLSYTDTKLEILSFSTAGTLLEGVADPVINEVNNTISFAFASTTPLEGAGSLLNIRFRVLREATGTATFAPLSARFNESFDAATSNGTVTIQNAPVIDVQQDDTEITIGETTQFSVITGGTAPYTWRSSNTEVATIDENTGVATGLRRGTVEIVAIDSENFESVPATLVVNDVTVSFPDTDVSSLDIFTLPLQTTDISGLGANSFETDIQFDPAVLQFEGVEQAGTLSDGYALSLSEESGVIQIAAAGTENLTGEGSILNLRFSIQDGTGLGTTTEVTPIALSFNEPGTDTPTATLRSGTVSYIDSSLPEKAVLSSPANGSVDVDLLPEYSWQAAAAAETYEIQISEVSDFSTLVEDQAGLTGTLYQMVNPLNELTTYYWRVRASNSSGNGPWSDAFSFTTVPGTPVPPVLTSPSDASVNVPVNANFEWESSQFSEEYFIEISEQPDFSVIAESATVSALTYQAQSLSFSTLYYWRVSGVNSQGTGDPSAVFSFTTEDDQQADIDPVASTVAATSPHVADGADASVVTVTLVDTNGDPVTGLAGNQFTISLTGSAGAGPVTETATAGIYTFEVTNSVAEQVTVTVTADGVQLNDTPSILFEAPAVIIDPAASTVAATSPHVADGADASVVTVTLVDTNGDPVTGLAGNQFTISLTGSAGAGPVTETATAGIYTFEVTNSVAEQVTVTVTADGAVLDDTPAILFEEPVLVIDSAASAVTATSPHTADGSDASLVSIALLYTNGDPASGLPQNLFDIVLTGSAVAGQISETGTAGTYSLEVTNSVAEQITVTVTVDGVQLNDTPAITFEEPLQIPEAPILVDITETASGTEIQWNAASEDFTSTYIIYRGDDIMNLQQIGTANTGTFSFQDNTLPDGISFYAISARNSEGGESGLSNSKSYVNSELIADTDWRLVSIPLSSGNVEADLATVFSYSNRYTVAESLDPASGYWIKTRTFDAETYNVSGNGLEQAVIQLNEGWNLIGAMSDTIPTSDISDPGNILSDASIFSYSNGQYEAVNELVPGAGYWIHADQSGEIELQLNLDPNMVPQGNKPASILADRHAEPSGISGELIQFRNAENSASLAIPDYGLYSNERLKYLLPPVAPDTPIDIRTEGGFSVIKFDSETRLNLTAIQFPVTIQYEGEISDTGNHFLRLRVIYSGEEVTTDLSSGQSFTLHEIPEHLSVSRIPGDEKIAESELLASYPNPFNPATTIHYRLENTSYVKVEVFDVAGRKVGVLADGVMESGEYRVRFDAQNLASGIYIVRFQNGNKLDLRKITLIK